ncbi:helix-turn-helix domain-containing protein [Arhodomonas sp. AD133]|uniref:helix-turn-helix domain-containing protein n=1 Tax=Arhodomonas sp. AD133 TaxID=3415009 RepID=UPI003EC00078
MIGDRIKQARHAAGLSQRALAERAQVSAMAVSKYENGKAAPSSTVLLALADALNVRVEYFLRPERVELEMQGYRKHHKAPKRLLDRIKADVKEKVERFLELEAILPVLPAGEFRVPPAVADRIDTYANVEQAAADVREAWGLGVNPIPDLIDTFEEHGIRVFRTSIPHDEHFDGLAALVQGSPVIVLGEEWPGDRQRFTLAHELGHLVLEGRLAESLDVELAANRFAGAFLVPEQAARRALGDKRHWLEPRELWLLKQEYGLSMAGWLHRARNLGIIPDQAYKRLRQEFKARGWLKKEPFGDYPGEQPRVFEQLVYRALAEDLIGESKAAELMGKPLMQFHTERTA